MRLRLTSRTSIGGVDTADGDVLALRVVFLLSVLVQPLRGEVAQADLAQVAVATPSFYIPADRRLR